MKDKEPDNLFFSADESPVPLPSMEEAWLNMRKKLDEEMPERALFFTWKRMGLLSILLLLSLGVFWFVERQGEREKADAVVNIEKADVKQTTDERQTEDPAKVTLKARKGEGLAKTAEGGHAKTTEGGHAAKAKEGLEDKIQEDPTEKTEEGRQNENASAKRTKALIDGEKRERTSVEGKTKKSAEKGQTEEKAEKSHRENSRNGQKENASSAVMKQKETHRREANKKDQSEDKWRDRQRGQSQDRRQYWPQDKLPDRRQVTTAAHGMQTRTAVADLPRLVRDPVLVWVNMPKSEGVGTRRPPARKENKNADQPGKTKKPIPGDSTRILWAAGLQDSKSFPVGAQQPVDYNANLKKDLWFDYVPAPYFQYFISKRIGFQVALQFNNPQYTEAVSIFKKKGAIIASFSNDTDIVVRKLYYLSIPLIIYYSPFRNFYLGAGLQFSNLSNGIAFQNNVVHYVGTGGGQRDTVTTLKLISLKEDRPAYNNLKRTDWRAILEMNYYWKRISLGVQLQQGLSDYLYTPVDGSTGKDKNSSFNIYLRYNLWERRIRIATR